MAEVTSIGRVNGKAAKILMEAADTGEPVFVLRAKDLLSVLGVTAYLRLIEDYTPENHDMHEGIINQLRAMRDWQGANPGEVRLPD